MIVIRIPTQVKAISTEGRTTPFRMSLSARGWLSVAGKGVTFQEWGFGGGTREGSRPGS